MSRPAGRFEEAPRNDARRSRTGRRFGHPPITRGLGANQPTGEPPISGIMCGLYRSICADMCGLGPDSVSSGGFSLVKSDL